MYILDECIAFIASNSAKKVTNDFNEILKSQGSTRVQWIALYFIFKNPGITMSGLAERMFIDNSAVLRLIERMSKEDLISRQGDETDKRLVKLTLTETGLKKATALMPICKRYSAIISEGISDDDIETFKRVFSVLMNNSSKDLNLF